MLSLETERLTLREFVQSDWEPANALVTDQQVTRYMHFARWDDARRRAWVAGMVGERHTPPRMPYNWAITLRGDGRLIGWLYVGTATDGPAAGTRGFGYALARAYWGNGYMPEALRAVFVYEFETLATQQINGECEQPNVASARVMEKCGMRFLGDFYAPDFEGHWARELHYTITREEYFSQRQ